MSEAGGSTLWKAIDEILARAVAVRTFTPEFPRVNAVVTAARAASRLTDPRLTQVFDADDSDELAYVVSEWVSGETLHDMVATRGPLEPGRAATLLYEAAEAVSAAHGAGLAHLRLTPHDLLWTTGGTVKLLGLGVEAALHGITTDAPAVVDAQGLGRMLYAALTAHSVADGDTGLPPAPTADGRPATPARLQGGVPPALDAIVRRTLDIDPPPGQPALDSPAALAEALARVPRTPLPLFAGLATGPTPQVPSRTTTTTTLPDPAGEVAQPRRTPPQAAPRPSVPGPRRQERRPAPPRPSPQHPPAAAHGAEAPPPYQQPTRTVRAGRPPADRQPVNRPLIAIAAVVAALVVGIGGWQMTRGNEGTGDRPSSSPSASASASAPKTVRLHIQDADGFDPTQPANPDSNVHPKAKYAIDGSKSTYWDTQRYASADFGRLKGGLGLLLDMGRPVRVQNVKVSLPGSGGATLQLRVGSSNQSDELKVVATDPSTSSAVTLQPQQPAEGRYVLLWFTKLPTDLKAKISNVDVYGSAD